MTRNLCTFVCGAALAMCLSRVVVADPLPGQFLKFQQRPMAGTFVPNPGGPEIFNGHDEGSTAYSMVDATGQIIGYEGRFMADDFADEFKSPVVHLKWWGSYLNDQTVPPGLGVRRFLISFESDIPATSANDFSRPGTPLLNQIVTLDSDSVLTPGSGTFTERIFHPVSIDGPIYEYNAELHFGKEFRQEPDKVYWLKIVALVDAPPTVPPEQRLRWGWHNRDYTIFDPLASPLPVPGEHNQFPMGPFPVWHFQDDAVDGSVFVGINPSDPMTQIMPFVQQTVRGPNDYLPLVDGPSIIGMFSKDLAFELYTVPEPACATLLVIALAALPWRRRRG